jgi:hypothetical protein
MTNSRIMWVRLKGHKIGVPIYVDPDQPLEDNKKFAVEAAKRHLKTVGWAAACSFMPEDYPSAGEVELDGMGRVVE